MRSKAFFSRGLMHNSEDFQQVASYAAGKYRRLSLITTLQLCAIAVMARLFRHGHMPPWTYDVSRSRVAVGKHSRGHGLFDARMR